MAPLMVPEKLTAHVMVPMHEALRPLSGATMVVLSGACLAANIILSRLLEDKGWPFFRLMGVSSLLIAVAGTLHILASQQGWRGLTFASKHDAAWIFARALTGNAEVILSVLAILAGAGAGDIGALGSVKTPVAALVGRLFLGERLQPLCYAAVVMSMVGSVLISQPWADHHEEAESDLPDWVGNSLALLSGIFMGLEFVTTRKCPEGSSWLQTVVVMYQRTLICLLLPLEVNTDGLHKLSEEPGATAGLMLALILVTFGGSYLFSEGGKRCPAAVSATLVTATSMGVGYYAQVVLFDSPPNPLELEGAALMLLSIVVMAVARRNSSEEASKAPEEPKEAAGEAAKQEPQEPCCSVVLSPDLHDGALRETATTSCPQAQIA